MPPSVSFLFIKVFSDSADFGISNVFTLNYIDNSFGIPLIYFVL